MWKWIKNFFINLLFLDKFVKQLPPASTENNDIKVEQVISAPIEVTLVPQPHSHEQLCFKSSINKVHEEFGWSEENYRKGIENLFNVELPLQYKSAVRCRTPTIVITSYHGFKGNDMMLKRASTTILRELRGLGIKDAYYSYNGIFIPTKSITTASEQWNEKDFTIEVKSSKQKTSPSPTPSSAKTKRRQL